MRGQWSIVVHEFLPEGECVVEHEVGGNDTNEVLMVIRSIIYNPHFMNRRKLIKQLTEMEALLEGVKKHVR